MSPISELNPLHGVFSSKLSLSFYSIYFHQLFSPTTNSLPELNEKSANKKIPLVWETAASLTIYEKELKFFVHLIFNTLFPLSFWIIFL